MTGPEHYQRAQEWAARAAEWPDFDRWDMTPEERIGRQQADAALAQVHATLALTCAEVHADHQAGHMTVAEAARWRAVGVLS